MEQCREINNKLERLEREALRFKNNCNTIELMQLEMMEMAEIWKQFIDNTPMLATLAQITGREFKLPQ